MQSSITGRMVEISDTRLHIVERGEGPPLIVLHGGPGCDHHLFADYLDPLGSDHRLILVDQRFQGRSDPAPVETLTLPRMAADVGELASALELGSYAVLGHSYGAFVALQQAVDNPGGASRTIVSSGMPSARYLAAVDANLAAFEPVELRAQVTESWAMEKDVQSQEDCERLMAMQMPFQFLDPRDPRIDEFNRRSAAAVYSPVVLRHFARQQYGGIELEARLSEIRQPVLVLAGRHDRTCVVEASEAMARGIPGARLVVFERSAHMTFVEEPEAYVAAVRDFLAGWRKTALQ